MTTLLLTSIPASYFNAAMICFFATVLRQHGLIFNPITSAKLMWPLIRAVLIGFVPAAALGNLLLAFAPSWGTVGLVLVSLGALLGAILIHRIVLGVVTRKVRWNWAIAVVTLIQFVISVSVFPPL